MKGKLKDPLKQYSSGVIYQLPVGTRWTDEWNWLHIRDPVSLSVRKQYLRAEGYETRVYGEGPQIFF